MSGERRRVRKPRLVIVGKTSFPHRPGEDLVRKFRILHRYWTPTVVGVGRLAVRSVAGTRLVTLPLKSLAFYLIGPLVALTRAAGRGPAALACQSPYEGAVALALSRPLPESLRPKVVVEVHGDWATAVPDRGRLFGALARRIAAWALRRADRVRTVSAATEELVRRAGYVGEVERFVTWSDFVEFLGVPTIRIPTDPRVAFVGVLRQHKGVDLLLEAWARVLDEVPGAALEVAGTGPMLSGLRARAAELELNGSIRWLGTVPRPEVRALLDRSTCLVLPSRSEGLPRIILEAFARGRPVVASAVGGIPELVRPGETGLLVPPDDPGALAEGLVRTLGDAAGARRMGESARRYAEDRDPVGEFESGMARLAAWVMAS